MITERQFCLITDSSSQLDGGVGKAAVLAAMLQDDLLATSLRELYLASLSEGRGGGEVSRQTLRAYFAAERNVSSTAPVLGVSRRTVTNRLRAIEERLGRPLSTCTAEMEAALRLQDFDDIAVRPGEMFRSS